MAERSVIIHYHLFKNAGSSVDEILRHNFGEKWVEIEGPDNKKLKPEMMEEFIRNNPHIKAISSHTAQITLPKISGVNIIPIFFFRHPIARIRSAYEFERIQDEDTPGAKMAKSGDFAHYLSWRLAQPTMNTIINFHATRLKDFRKTTYNRDAHLFRQRSVNALKAMPVVGLVERFDESMEKFAAIIRPHFPEFELLDVRANSNSDPAKSLRDKLSQFEGEIGRETFVNLAQLNALDLELYYFVTEKLWAK